MSANGYLRDDELTTVQGSGANAIRLSLGFAAVLRRMQADAAKDGVRITLVSSYHGAAGYRSRATQLDMRAHPSLYSITPGIVPGLPSEHGTGNCGDIDQGLAWVKKNGARYGVTFPLAFDHNHARWDGITLAGESGTPITTTAPPRRHDDMSKLYYKQGSTPTLYALAGDSPGTPANWLETTDQGLANGWSAQIGAPSVLLSAGTFDSYKAAYLAPLATAGSSSGSASIDYDKLGAAVVKAMPKTITLS